MMCWISSLSSLWMPREMNMYSNNGSTLTGKHNGVRFVGRRLAGRIYDPFRRLVMSDAEADRCNREVDLPDVRPGPFMRSGFRVSSVAGSGGTADELELILHGTTMVLDWCAPYILGPPN